MRKLFFLLVAFFLINGCSIDDSSEQDQIIDGGTITRFQVVSIQVDNLNDTNFQGSINGNSIELMKTESNTIAFFVDENFSLGEYILEIPSLEKKIRYTINETVLNNTIDTTLASLSSNFNNHVDTLGNTPEEIYVTNTIDNFNSTLLQLNEDNRKKIALVYQANKSFFDNLYQVDYTIPQGRMMLSDYSNLTNKQLIGNFAAATIGAGITTAGAILAASNPFIAIPFAIAAITLWEITYDLASECLSRVTVYTQLKWDQIVSFVTNRNLMTNLEFINGMEKSINFDLGARGFNNSDNNSSNTIINLFFSSFNDFNGIINDLNGVITIVNNIPFTDISLIDNIEVGNSSEETISATETFFNSLTISLSSDNDNLELSSPTFTDGNINMTITIIDETIVDEFVETTINYSYQDDTNEFTGSFPIKVYKDEIDLSGTWYMAPTGSCSQGSIPGGTAYTFVFNSNNTISFTGIYASFNDGSSITNNYQLNGANLSINWNTIEGGYSSDDCNGTIYDFSIDDSISYNGSYQNTTNDFVGNYSISSFEIPNYPCAENLVCNGSMRIYK